MKFWSASPPDVRCWATGKKSQPFREFRAAHGAYGAGLSFGVRACKVEADSCETWGVQACCNICGFTALRIQDLSSEEGLGSVIRTGLWFGRALALPFRPSQTHDLPTRTTKSQALKPDQATTLKLYTLHPQPPAFL